MKFAPDLCVTCDCYKLICSSQIDLVVCKYIFIYLRGTGFSIHQYQQKQESDASFCQSTFAPKHRCLKPGHPHGLYRCFQGLLEEVKPRMARQKPTYSTCLLMPAGNVGNNMKIGGDY